MKLFVAHLNDSVTEHDLKELFSRVGSVESVVIPLKESGVRRGFAFVEMLRDDQGANAIRDFNGHHYFGRCIHVEQARERDDAHIPQPFYNSIWKTMQTYYAASVNPRVTHGENSGFESGCPIKRCKNRRG